MVVNLVYKTTNMMEETIMADKAYEYMDWAPDRGDRLWGGGITS